MRRRGIGPGVCERPETGLALADHRERVQQVAGGSREAVKPRHHQHVAGVELAEQAGELCPVGLVALRHLAEHLARPVLLQRRNLGGLALAACRDARVTENHKAILHQISATKKRIRIKGLVLVRKS